MRRANALRLRWSPDRQVAQVPRWYVGFCRSLAFLADRGCDCAVAGPSQDP